MICSCCKEFFEKGTGHSCYCSECNKVHPYCQECYEEGVRTGGIKDVHYKKMETSPRSDERLI